MLIYKEKQKNKNINFKNKNIEKKYTWYDWLINYIPEPIKKIVGGFKDKVVNLFNTNTSKQTVSGTGNKLIKPKTQKQSEENLINIIRNCFIQKNETKVKKNKDRIIIIFEEEENYYKLKRVSKFWNNNYTEYGSNGDRNTNLSLGGSKKKPTINPKNKDDMVTFALHYQEIKSNPEKVSNIKLFRNKYKWRGTKHIPTIALNILHITEK